MYLSTEVLSTMRHPPHMSLCIENADTYYVFRNPSDNISMNDFTRAQFFTPWNVVEAYLTPLLFYELHHSIEHATLHRTNRLYVDITNQLGCIMISPGLEVGAHLKLLCFIDIRI